MRLSSCCIALLGFPTSKTHLWQATVLGEEAAILAESLKHFGKAFPST